MCIFKNWQLLIACMKYSSYQLLHISRTYKFSHLRLIISCCSIFRCLQTLNTCAHLYAFFAVVIVYFDHNMIQPKFFHRILVLFSHDADVTIAVQLLRLIHIGYCSSRVTYIYISVCMCMYTLEAEESPSYIRFWSVDTKCSHTGILCIHYVRVIVFLHI